jgi:hypothetical protein
LLYSKRLGSGAGQNRTEEGKLERKILLIGLALTLGAVGMFLYERSRGPATGAKVNPESLVS